MAFGGLPIQDRIYEFVSDGVAMRIDSEFGYFDIAHFDARADHASRA